MKLFALHISYSTKKIIYSFISPFCPDPDPGRTKTCGSCGSGSETLPKIKGTSEMLWDGGDSKLLRIDLTLIEGCFRMQNKVSVKESIEYYNILCMSL